MQQITSRNQAIIPVIALTVLFFAVFVSSASAFTTGGSSDGCGCGSDSGSTSSSNNNGNHGGGNNYTPEPPPHYNAPVCTITASVNPVAYNGSSVLSYNSENATAASISEIGTVAVNGTHTVSSLTGTHTYVMTVSGPGGTGSCSTTVTVNPPVAPTCTISASPNDVPYNGSANLTWSSSNATAASIDNGIGSVQTSGSYGVSGITSNHTYTMTVTGTAGSATCATTVTTHVQVVPPTCSLTVSNTNIYNGGNAVLSWSSNNATSANISPALGQVNLNGSQTVYPPNSGTTYVMTVYGDGGTNTCTAVVNNVIQYQEPSCTIYANPVTIPQGGYSNITWQVNNAVSAWIDGNIGNVPMYGSRQVSPYAAQTYTLTVQGINGQMRTCNTTIYPIARPVPQPVVSVSLNQVPYTGINSDAYTYGVFAVTFAAWALVAYALYTRRGLIGIK